MPPLLEIDQLKIDARKDDGSLMPIIKGVSFSVERGEVVALIGESAMLDKTAQPVNALTAAFAKDGRKVDYYNVVEETSHLETMLKHSNGTRKVPVIVEGDAVTIGFEGGT